MKEQTDGPTDGPTDGRTDGQTILQRCFIAPKKTLLDPMDLAIPSFHRNHPESFSEHINDCFSVEPITDNQGLISLLFSGIIIKLMSNKAQWAETE